MEEIIKELHTLKLSGMARLWASLGETKRLDKLTLVDGIMLLLQAERDTRTTNRNNRLVKEADFRYSATLEQLQAGSHRGVDSNMLAVLGTGSYIDKGEAILITRPPRRQHVVTDPLAIDETAIQPERADV